MTLVVSGNPDFVLNNHHPEVLALTLFYAGRYHSRFRRWQEIRLSDLCLSPYLTS